MDHFGRFGSANSLNFTWSLGQFYYNALLVEHACRKLDWLTQPLAAADKSCLLSLNQSRVFSRSAAYTDAELDISIATHSLTGITPRAFQPRNCKLFG